MSWSINYFLFIRMCTIFFQQLSIWERNFGVLAESGEIKSQIDSLGQFYDKVKYLNQLNTKHDTTKCFTHSLASEPTYEVEH